MANNITKQTDYEGYTLLAIEDVSYFAEFAEEIEKKILRGDGITDFGLLGDEVYTALIADLDSNNEPQTAPWIQLVDGETYNNNGTIQIYEGIRKLLTYFVYCEYLKENSAPTVGTGIVDLRFQWADKVSKKQLNYKAHLRWNKGVGIFNGQAYDYILFNQTSFTNWDFTQQSNYITRGII